MTEARDPDALLTCREVADRYKVHPETVRRWVRKEIIAVIRVGPHRLVRITEREAAKHFQSVPGADV